MNIFRTICFCTDFSDTADKAFDYALNLAQTYGSALVIFHAVHQPVYPALAEPYVMSQVVDLAEDRLRQEAEEDIRKKYLSRVPSDLSCEAMVRSGSPAQEILQLVKDKGIDLVIMGTRGRSPLELLVFGSVAQRVVKRAPCPVLTVSTLVGKD